MRTAISRAKQAARRDGHDPDEIVSTQARDQDGNNIEMPIWQTYLATQARTP